MVHLTQACAVAPGDMDITIVVKRALPTRLTYCVQLELILLCILQQDPDLSVQLFRQDIIFDPPVLMFSKSSEVSFCITGTSLGHKRITLRQSGSKALLYSGLPLSSSVVIERVFMRNMFQPAFSDMHCDKRRYMFSVDDPVLRHQWAASLKRQVEAASSNYAMLATDSVAPPRSISPYASVQIGVLKVTNGWMSGPGVIPAHEPSRLVKNLDASGRGRKFGQTAKNASANKERGRVWNAIGTTHFTSCSSNSTNDINCSNKADL